AIVDKVRYFLNQATDVKVDAEEREVMTELGKKWERYRVAVFDRQLKKQIRQECAVDNLRENILLVLRARHLPSSKALAERLQACTDDATLKRWLERAAVVATPAEVFAEG